ncbi:MAG TPA: hypothetical protein VG818_12365 [Gemmatimonadaceae bacterium]|jgi:tetratricopeptide (TPR) repeat protein|nr:hypothetical protein [Gemmatimonadaceae bacterium]
MKLPALALAALVVAAPLARAQSAADHIAEGDKAHAALNATAALKHYEAAIAVDPTNAEALWKAARDAIDLGEAAGFQHNNATRDSLYKVAEQYATRAVQANPKLGATHFTLAKALGRAALTLGSRERVKYAGRVRSEALAALAIDSLDDGALHVMGVWNAEIMRLNSFARFLARNLLGGQVLGEASWASAQRYLERSVAIAPNRIVHHLDLGDVYADVGDKARAREQYQQVLALPATEFNDKDYQQQARDKLARL